MKANIHYEAAFEDYVRRCGIPYVNVDEAKRAAFRDAKLKSFDFIVYSSSYRWLVDVKGRRWTTRTSQRRATWENWATEADLEGLAQWEEVFGEQFRAVLIFAYWLDGDIEPPADLLHEFRGVRYVFAGVPLRDYQLHARVRSPKWGTVNLSAADFRRYVRPLVDLFAGAAPYISDEADTDDSLAPLRLAAKMA